MLKNTLSTTPSTTPFAAWYTGLAACLVALLAACAQTPAAAPPPPPPDDAAPPSAERPDEPHETSLLPRIIFDTDLGYDADDAGALAVLHALADNGEAEILATMTVVGDPYSAGALSVINTYYGRPELPIGTYMGERWLNAHPFWFEDDRDFLKPLVEEYPSPIRTRDEAQEAVSLYRETLAAQPDNSVTIVTVGFLQNLADLLTSGPDEHSPLSGPELVAQKVNKLVVMGGEHPENSENIEFNFRGGPENDGRATQAVVRDWPTRIVFSGAEIGNAIMTGSGLADTLPDNPVARAYELYPGTNAFGERQSWDLTAVLYAVRGAGELWTVGEDKHLEVFEDGSHRWLPGSVEPSRAYLVEKADPEVVKQILDELLVQPPHSAAAP
jgi:inosine-uridine nucleoside N-ribohydrolase